METRDCWPVRLTANSLPRHSMKLCQNPDDKRVADLGITQMAQSQTPQEQLSSEL